MEYVKSVLGAVGAAVVARRWVLTLVVLVTLALGALGAGRVANAGPAIACGVPGICGSAWYYQNTATVGWWAEGVKYDFYQLYWKRPGYSSPISRVNGTSFKVTNAWRNTTYTFYVRGCNTRRFAGFLWRLNDRCSNEWYSFGTNSAWSR